MLRVPLDSVPQRFERKNHCTCTNEFARHTIYCPGLPSQVKCAGLLPHVSKSASVRQKGIFKVKIRQSPSLVIHCTNGHGLTVVSMDGCGGLRTLGMAGHNEGRLVKQELNQEPFAAHLKNARCHR